MHRQRRNYITHHARAHTHTRARSITVRTNGNEFANFGKTAEKLFSMKAIFFELVLAAEFKMFHKSRVVEVEFLKVLSRAIL